MSKNFSNKKQLKKFFFLKKLFNESILKPRLEKIEYRKDGLLKPDDDENVNLLKIKLCSNGLSKKQVSIEIEEIEANENIESKKFFLKKKDEALMKL